MIRCGFLHALRLMAMCDWIRPNEAHTFSSCRCGTRVDNGADVHWRSLEKSGTCCWWSSQWKRLSTFTKSDRAKRNAAFSLISDGLPFGRLWYGEPNAVSNAIGYAEHYSRSHEAVIRVYDEAGNVIERRTSTKAISKSGNNSAVLLFVQDRLSWGLA